MGRPFTDSDDQGAAGLVTVISDHAWREYFASKPSLIGEAVLINGLPATVIGVAAPHFRGTQLAPSADAWIPVMALARAVGSSEALSNRDYDERLNAPFAGNFVHVLARLNDNASLAQARTEMTVLWERLRAQYPDGQQESSVTVLPYSATAGGNSLLSTQSTTFLAIFSVITMLTLMIVCANVANLLLGRATVRQRELALRQSLGASRTRIVRMLLAEGLVIALLAGMAAYLFAWWMSGLIANLVTPMVPPGVLQVITATDWTVAGYALTLALGCMTFFTIAPAARAWRQSLLPWLKAGEPGVVPGRSRLSSGLVVLQLALAVLLITSAGLASRSIALFASADLGFDSKSILTATVNTGGGATDAQTSAALLERLRTRLQGIPGIESVSQSWNARQVAQTEPVAGGMRETVDVQANFVGPDYLRVYGVTLLSGRELGIESASIMTPAIVTQALAERLWPGQPPIGRRLLVGRQRQREAEVVGVAPNVMFNGNRPTGNLYILLPAADDPRGPGERTLYLQYRGRLEAIAPAIGQAIRAEDPDVPVVNLRTLDSQLAIDFWPVRAVTTLLALFALGSLLIAIVGQYAVVAFDMRRRIREFGVRIAMGASSRQILTSVLQEGFRLTALGLVIGFGLSVLTGIGLSRALYGVTPTDPLTYGSVFVLLCVVSIAACSLPAVRASRVNPIATLRQE
jgi:predicted permease